MKIVLNEISFFRRFFEITGEVILLLSSFYFSAFLFLTLLVLGLGLKFGFVAVVWASLFLLYAVFYFLPPEKEKLFVDMFKIFGSVVFLSLFSISYFLKDIEIVRLFILHTDMVQKVANTASVHILLTILLYGAIGFIILELVIFYVNLAGYLEKYSKFVGKVMTGLFIVMAIVGFNLLIEEGHDLIYKIAIKGTPFFLPFIGFSLVYIHANFLIKIFIHKVKIDQTPPLIR